MDTKAILSVSIGFFVFLFLVTAFYQFIVTHEYEEQQLFDFTFEEFEKKWEIVARAKGLEEEMRTFENVKINQNQIKFEVTGDMVIFIESERGFLKSPKSGRVHAITVLYQKKYNEKKKEFYEFYLFINKMARPLMTEEALKYNLDSLIERARTDENGIVINGDYSKGTVSESISMDEFSTYYSIHLGSY